MRGDILLYHDTDLVSRLIQWWTRGPYNHVAIDLGNGTQLAAEPSGVKVRPFPQPTVPDQLRYVNIHAFYLQDEVVERGLALVMKQVNDGYSGADIIDDVFPSWFPIHLFQAHHYDCSDLVARYLDEIAVLPLADLGGDAATVTPNDLYRALKARGYL